MNRHQKNQLLRFRWEIFLILAFAYLLVYFHRLSFSVVADNLIREFNTTASTLGLLGSIYFYCYAFMQLPAGLLSDSIGPRKTVTFFLLIAAIGSIIFGLAPNIETAFIGRILVGFGVSMVFIPTMKILSQWFRPYEFAFMAGLLNAVGGIGVFAATGLLAFMTINFGWRLSFELIGVCTAIITVLCWLIVRDRPKDKGWPSVNMIDNRKTEPPVDSPQISLSESVKRVLSEKHFWPVAAWFFFDCGIFFGFGALWGGPFLMHVYNLSHAETGTVLSMIALGMIIGSPAIGLISDKLIKSRKIPFMICSLLLTIDIFLLYLFPAGFTKFSLCILFFIFSLSSSAIVVIGFTTTKELFPVSIAGTSVGTVNLFPFLGGAVFMPFLGKILDAYPKTENGSYSAEGYSTLLLVLLFSALAAFTCTLFMKETFSE
ncbi:MAG: MFS transporter [Desulfobacteraceae bacterium]|nr:MFS transporter [Desulfobacteraceae bacterium]MBC2757991.1 MFS transporter [Desulfobacteraceae bacterium]